MSYPANAIIVILALAVPFAFMVGFVIGRDKQ